jgi:hypothetical protein
MYAQTVADVEDIYGLLVIDSFMLISGRRGKNASTMRLCLVSITLLKKNLHGLDGSDYED